MGTMIEIRCKKCSKSWSHNIGVGFITGPDSRQIMPDDEELLKGYIPASARPEILEMAKTKTIFLDLYSGKMMCKCNKCNTFNSRLAAKVVDENNNTIYEVLPQKCPKCNQRMHYIDLEDEDDSKDIDLDDEDFHFANEDERLSKELAICPECGGRLGCYESGNWD